VVGAHGDREEKGKGFSSWKSHSIEAERGGVTSLLIARYTPQKSNNWGGSWRRLDFTGDERSMGGSGCQGKVDKNTSDCELSTLNITVPHVL